MYENPESIGEGNTNFSSGQSDGLKKRTELFNTISFYFIV